MSEYKHTGRIDIFRECQQCPDFFDILHNVADIAGADAETFSCNNCILRSDHGIFHSKEQITGTGYDDSRGGIPCIYVEVSAPGGERVDRYWISVESGLLISSETLEGEELLYRMTAYSPIQSCPSGTTFQLPDGTVLHSI